MKIKYLALVWLTGFASVEAAAQSAPPTIKPSAKSDQPTYIITAHTVAHDETTSSQLDNYIIVYGSEALKVQYAESQISTVKPGASLLEQVAPGKNLHLHSRYGVWPQEPDVSQVPQVGVPIRACEMDTKHPDKDGHPVIAIQSVSAPCMSRNGDTLHYTLAPNGGVRMWEYVNFDILEATNSVGVAAAQSAPLRKDIPAIAKAAGGAIVTIIAAANDKPIAQGTGFLVSADGVIVTNYHVIKEGNVAIVKFPDDTAFSVDGVLASDKVRDLAIIKIHGKTFRTLALGDSDDIQVGEEVVAIGNPLSLESTVSNGIISGVRTSKEQGGKFLQTTAPISPGSSGGPLFNMHGEVVGINTLYLEGGENLNFAIPVNDAKLLLSHQSAKLQNLPNESEPKEVPPEESPAPPSAGQALDSPAYRQYQELLKANDLTIRTGIYACFYDNKERAKNFFVISANLLNKHAMQALVNNFTDGVLGDSPSIFGGKIQQFSSKQGIFADLPTSYDHKNSIDKSHETDVFKWVSGDIAIEAGWGKLTPGQVRMGYRFKLQHSTGRFIEDTELNFPGADSSSNSTIHEPGRCVRIPNIAMTPEEQYELVDN
jgi:hypothetical protein